MRNQCFLKLVLLFLCGLVCGVSGSLRASAEPEDPDAVEIIVRKLQDDTNATGGEDPSDWFGGNEGETETPAEVPAGDEDVDVEPGDNVDTNTTIDTPEDSTPEDAATDNPENWDTKPETEPPTGEGEAPQDDMTGDDMAGDDMAGDDMAGDDMAGDDDYDAMEGEGEWGEPEDEGTKAPYVPPTGDDPFADGGKEEQKIENQWHPDTGTNRPPETLEEMEKDPNVIIAIGCAVGFGFVLALCSVQQVIENPDGCCASICRCAVKVFCCFFKILCFPCRMCCGNKDRRTHDLMIGNSDSYTHDLELS